MQVRWVVNLVFPPFGLQMPVPGPLRLTYTDQVAMLEAAIEAAPSEKWNTAADYVFLITFEQRQGSIGFVACLAAAVYGAFLPVQERHPLHLIFGVIALGMTVINLNHAGFPYFWESILYGDE
jgi:hypothetical protein